MSGAPAGPPPAAPHHAHDGGLTLHAHAAPAVRRECWAKVREGASSDDPQDPHPSFATTIRFPVHEIDSEASDADLPSWNDHMPPARRIAVSRISSITVAVSFRRSFTPIKNKSNNPMDDLESPRKRRPDLSDADCTKRQRCHDAHGHGPRPHQHHPPLSSSMMAAPCNSSSKNVLLPSQRHHQQQVDDRFGSSPPSRGSSSSPSSSSCTSPPLSDILAHPGHQSAFTVVCRPAMGNHTTHVTNMFCTMSQ
jgi:hypothetical protein